jgi:hypothetical protein
MPQHSIAMHEITRSETWSHATTVFGECDPRSASIEKACAVPVNFPGAAQAYRFNELENELRADLKLA